VTSLLVTNDFPPRPGGIQQFVHNLAVRQPADSLVVYASRWRGWDKFDISPVGGNRMAYSSIEYRYTGLALFLDVGSVWDANTERKVRVSTGFGFHAGPAFFVVGFPLNTDNVRAVFTMGLRVSGVGIKW